MQSLQSHCAQSNDAHLLAVDRTKNLAKEKSGHLSEAQEAVNSLRELERERLKYLFIDVYSLMSKGRPYSEYEFYFEMGKAKGIDIGNTYKTRQDAMERSYAITSIEVNKLRSLFYNSNFFSIITDESTDVYRLEQVIAFIRFSKRGAVMTKFLGIDDVIRPNAEQITSRLLSLLKTVLNWKPPEHVLVEPELQDEEVAVLDDAEVSRCDDEVLCGMEEMANILSQDTDKVSKEVGQSEI